jgi:hypothetical protein
MEKGELPMKCTGGLILSAVLLICQSCSTSKKPEWLGYTTQKLWDSNNPNARIWIDADKITEEELKQRGVDYTHFSSNKFNGYMVEKSQEEKMRGFYLRMLATPVTLTVDAATVVAVVGVFAGASYVVGGEWVSHINAD